MEFKGHSGHGRIREVRITDGQFLPKGARINIEEILQNAEIFEDVIDARDTIATMTEEIKALCDEIAAKEKALGLGGELWEAVYERSAY